MTSPKVKFSDIELAFEFANFGYPGEAEAYICRRTGRTYTYTQIDPDLEEPLPEDIHDEEKYLPLPHKNELGLGKPLVLEFASEHLPEHYDKVREIFSSPGAYARFKDLLEYQDKLQLWHDYEDKAEEEALRQWCRDNGIEIEDDNSE